MLVSYVRGDAFSPSPSFRPDNWNFGEAKRCEIASDGSIQPDKGRDLLLCGDSTRMGWSQTWLRGDIKRQIYDAARTLRVNFHSAGHGGGRSKSRWWQCRRTAEGLDCE